MSELDEYLNRKNALLKSYEMVMGSGDDFWTEFRASGDGGQAVVTMEDVTQRHSDLENDRFLVSFSGQIKAGKSTLINALVLQDDVLPVDDSPHTAKITVLKHGEAPGFVADFYSTEEWRTLRAQEFNGEPGGYFREFLRSAVNDAQEQHGIYAKEMITGAGRTMRVDDTNQLIEYVAAGGRYTPFVKSVTLYSPRDILRHITVVDTPGLNDPNRYRSQLTKDWMNRSSANIYVLYASQAMQQGDVDFIDEFLIGLPASHQLLAVNKLDAVNKPGEVESWLGGLLSNGLGSRRLGLADSVVYVSGLAALIDCLSDDLPAKLLCDAERLDRMGFLDAERHGLGKLRGLIEKRLIENKGNALLTQHHEFLSSIFSRKVRRIDLRLAENTESLKHCRGDLEELEAKRGRLRTQEQEVGDIFNDFKHRLQKRRAECTRRLQPKIDTISDDILDIVRVKITALAKLKEYRSEVYWYVKNAVDECRGRIESEGHSVADELGRDLHAELVRCRDRLSGYKAIYIGFMDDLIDVAFDDNIRRIQSEADTVFSEKGINQLVKENTFFIQRWFDTRGGKKQAREALIKELQQFLKLRISQRFVQSFMDEVQTSNNDLRGNLQREVEEVIATLREDLNEVIETYDHRQEREHAVMAEADALHARRDRITALQGEALKA